MIRLAPFPSKALVAALLCLGLVIGTAHAEPTEARAARELARIHLARATELRGAGQNAEAYEELLKAWLSSKSFDIACNLGHTALDLRRYREAAEHLDYCVRFHILSNQPELIERERSARASLKFAREHVGTIELSVLPNGAEVWVEDRLLGLAPLRAPVFVEPGTTRLSVLLSGYETQDLPIHVLPGSSRRLAVQLEPIPIKTATAAPPRLLGPTPIAAPPGNKHVPRSNERPGEPGGGITSRSVVLLAGSGAALVAAGMGAAFGISALAAENDVNRYRATLKALGQACHAGETTSRICASLRSAVARTNQNDAFSTGAWIAAGTLSAGTLAVWLLWGSEASSARSARIGKPLIAVETRMLADSASVLVSGCF